MLTSWTPLFLLCMTKGALNTMNIQPKWQHPPKLPFTDGQLKHVIAPTDLKTYVQFRGLGDESSKMKTVGIFQFLRSMLDLLEGKHWSRKRVPEPGHAGKMPSACLARYSSGAFSNLTVRTRRFCGGRERSSLYSAMFCVGMPLTSRFLILEPQPWPLVRAWMLEVTSKIWWKVSGVSVGNLWIHGCFCPI